MSHNGLHQLFNLDGKVAFVTHITAYQVLNRSLPQF